MRKRYRVHIALGYVHTVTFSHRFLLFGSKLEFPWDCGTIQSHAKTLPCARSLNLKWKSYKLRGTTSDLYIRLER